MSGLTVTAPGVPEGPSVTTPETIPNAPSSAVANTGNSAGSATSSSSTGVTGQGQVYQGAALPGVGANDFTTLNFIAQQLISQISTATLVKIQAVYPASGSGTLLPGTIGPAGLVDVLPLVNMLDGSGNSYPHTTVYGLLYFRAVGGPNAVIIDPEPGDIGLAVFADRDISIVKNTGAQANPGSRRRFDLPDGIYIGGLLASTPNQYISFTKDGSGNRGTIIHDANNNSITTASSGVTISTSGGSMQLDTSGNLHVTGNVYWNTSTTATNAAGHIHSNVQGGTGTSGAPVPGS